VTQLLPLETICSQGLCPLQQVRMTISGEHLDFPDLLRLGGVNFFVPPSWQLLFGLIFFQACTCHHSGYSWTWREKEGKKDFSLDLFKCKKLTGSLPYKMSFEN
jgi:hypothetical protein